jgi:hypothetical protein
MYGKYGFHHHISKIDQSQKEMYKIGDPKMNRVLDKVNNIASPKPLERVKQE